ncbi:hypothetical protein [Paenibacillus agaridevorans]|uniref:hypothetical protein n=1 Tax=Paenibacillus agaridevorans TaxID=171404 RepID=UPI001BE3DEF2|nr:hypothetical protein [Paenibacillus agaridevorans]
MTTTKSKGSDDMVLIKTHLRKNSQGRMHKVLSHYRPAKRQLRGIKEWVKDDRSIVKPLFREIVGNRLTDKEIADYFEETYFTVGKIYHHDLTPQQHAYYMARQVDTVKQIREFKRNWNKEETTT